ncbi:hypothetical protein EIN_058670 [Entamoeba invadens IP1]|uniref:hypothetical protein n=1 Tax=Entamoeba invadens IP1 TaxID=370355 RepID=UPI0002C3DC7F|nr:hypothetical protein EIN_058670 [Entamoeba invadens IP1]ELP93412.1 hypothetical protein EIN_058670 [Entamoeba invadens IP1]|eukprot:XP_004260183.1 hypothetical protein EIN_058670 [Entamoeba invadens IP1]
MEAEKEDVQQKAWFTILSPFEKRMVIQNGYTREEELEFIERYRKHQFELHPQPPQNNVIPLNGAPHVNVNNVGPGNNIAVPQNGQPGFFPVPLPNIPNPPNQDDDNNSDSDNENDEFERQNEVTQLNPEQLEKRRITALKRMRQSEEITSAPINASQQDLYTNPHIYIVP